MKHNASVILLSAIIFWAACSTQQDSEALDRDRIEQEVTAVFNAYVEHLNSEGLAGAEAYFSEDDRFYWVEDGRVQYPNHAALVAGINDFSPGVKSLNMQVTDTKIDVLSENYATLYAAYEEDIVLKSGYEFTLDGAMTTLMIREQGTWKFFIGHSSVKKPRGGN